MSRSYSRRQFLSASAMLVPLATLRCARDGRDPTPRTERSVTRVLASGTTRDGAGVLLHRALGSQALSYLDPFLLLDEFHSANPADFIAGFPSHPHRGFETVSYVLNGAVEHRDSVGNHGRIGGGDAQWMTAGRGIVHSEMPTAAPGSELWGFQLWVNLPARDKMQRPRYQNIDTPMIPEVDAGDARVRVVAGTAGGRSGPVKGIVVSPTMLDVTIPAGGRFAQSLPNSQSAFAYVLYGEAALGAEGTLVSAGHLVTFGEGSSVRASATDEARFLLFAGTPIGEPIARSGPFVMNTAQEIQQAWSDYRSGRLVDGA